ncbi:hypothetical protein QBC37DRAFT_391033 [Rhypophila decipiens]|uniref:Uncharacterized protein n=1 Tax=Rhypophila decipiens TaxID=261697 RepID=A0AAN6Y1V2_9PEZI|nr:hypothetical protein QBC37DRAFT_391033 [Rhypophila decipiens]
MSLPSPPSPRNDLLKADWKTRLPNTAFDSVTRFVNQHGVYGASNGYLHRLSPRTGSRLKTISIRSSRVVQLTAPPSSSQLIVGTRGRVLALDPISLSTVWETVLPHVGDTNDGNVSILHRVQNISGGGALSLYAASLGYVYRIDPWTGTIVANNSLRGGCFYEVRLRMDTSTSTTTAGGVLLVGTHGRVYALDPFTLETIWRSKLPLPTQDPSQPEYRKRDYYPKGQITDVLCGSSADTSSTTAGETRTQVLHAFWQGYHFQLTRQDGTVLKRSLMGKLMTSDLSLTLDDNPNKGVYIMDRSCGERICAYICKREQSLKWTYRHQVFSSSRLHGTVIPGQNGMAWFSEPNRAVLLDKEGKEVASHRFDVSFGRDRQPRLAIYTDQTGDGAIRNVLIVGISGRCVALVIPTDVFRLDGQTAVQTQLSRIPVEPSLGTGGMKISETVGPDVMDTGSEEKNDAPPSYFKSQEEYRRLPR